MGEYTEAVPGSLIPGSQHLVYEIINENTVRIKSYSQYSNFTALTSYDKKYIITDEPCVDSGVSYELEGITRKYYTLASLDSI